MEDLMKQQWKDDEEEEESLVKRRAGEAHHHHHMQVTSTTITATSKLQLQATEQTNGSSGLKKEEQEADVNSPLLDPVISVDSIFLSSVRRSESERVGIITENDQQVLLLEGLYQKTSTQGFYCPNCRTCIQKVLLLEQPQQPTVRFRCSSCFSFLIPIGSWLFPGWFQEEVSNIPGEQQPPVTSNITAQAHKTPQVSILPPDGADKSSIEQDDKTSNSSSSSSSSDEIPQYEHDGSKIKPSHGGFTFGAPILDLLPRKDDINTSEKPELPWLQPEVQVTVEGRTDVLVRPTIIAPTQPGIESSPTWEILKSTVYGGLVESIASLGIVTSSSSSDATTLNILVLSLANLIGGLFIIVHNIWDLKSEQPRRANNKSNAHIDWYHQILGKREHFCLHVFISILSFIIFGLVPPLVYAFTFTEDTIHKHNKDLKLAAVAIASAICITLLSIAKAHIQRPDSYLTYLKTVIQYLSTSALTSVVSYLAGQLVKEAIENLGWFDTKGSSFSLLLPEMILEKPRFGSY